MAHTLATLEFYTDADNRRRAVFSVGGTIVTDTAHGSGMYHTADRKLAELGYVRRTGFHLRRGGVLAADVHQTDRAAAVLGDEEG